LLCIFIQVGMLLRRAKASEVYMQKENPEAIPVLIKHIKEALKTAKLQGKKPDIKKEKQKQESVSTASKGNSQIAYQVSVNFGPVICIGNKMKVYFFLFIYKPQTQSLKGLLSGNL